MLFSVMLGVITASYFGLRKLWIKVKYSMLGGKAEAIDKEKIPVVIYSDSKRYWNVFEYVVNELEARGIRSEYWTQSEDDPAFSKEYKHVTCRYIGSINKAITKLNVMNAHICLSTTPGLDVYQWKRSKNTDCYIHIYHTVSSGLLYRMFALDYYDVVMLSGDYIEENLRKLESIRNLPAKELVKIGLPHFDRMYDEVSSRTFDKPSLTTVLLAPTWGVNSLFNTLGDELIDRLIETGYNIVIRPHPQSYTAEADLIDRLKKKYQETDKLHWNSDNDNINVLGCSDIMISDYSGVIYDYIIIYDKPVIYSFDEFNKDPYDAWCVEESPKMITMLPEIAVQIKKDEIGNIKKMIDEALSDDARNKARAFAREHFWYNHGSSAKECVDYIEEKIAKIKTTGE